MASHWSCSKAQKNNVGGAIFCVNPTLTTHFYLNLCSFMLLDWYRDLWGRLDVFCTWMAKRYRNASWSAMIGDMSYGVGGGCTGWPVWRQERYTQKKTKTHTIISPLNVNTYCRSEDGGLVQVRVFLYKHSWNGPSYILSLVQRPSPGRELSHSDSSADNWLKECQALGDEHQTLHCAFPNGFSKLMAVWEKLARIRQGK